MIAKDPSTEINPENLSKLLKKNKYKITNKVICKTREEERPKIMHKLQEAFV
jgi:hypothetical protein